jgi:hypothetical protein
MNNAIIADKVLRDLALATARNNVGAMHPPAMVAAGEGITLVEYQALAGDPTFSKYLTQYEAELKQNGFSFESKARVLAEDLLPTMYHMARDPDVPAATRVKIHENMVEWGKLKPPKSDGAGAPGTGFSITINLPAQGSQGPSTLVLEGVQDNAPPMLSFAELFDESDAYEYAGDDYPPPP